MKEGLEAVWTQACYRKEVVLPQKPDIALGSELEVQSIVSSGQREDRLSPASADLQHIKGTSPK
jgi:hypothetical protein